MPERRPSFAGSFYPLDPEELAAVVDGYIADAGEPTGKRVLGVISPHAGYVYSGPAAGYSFREVRASRAARALVLAPSHRISFSGAAVFARGSYSTPLGDAAVDEEVCASFIGRPLFTEMYDIHRGEHSLEVQVPFIQRALPGAEIIPLIIGTADIQKCADIAGSIYEALSETDGDTVVIVSTDLSHYHSYKEAVEIDTYFIETLKKFDARELDIVLRNRDAEACGHGPLLTAIPLLKLMGAKSVEILRYMNSGDTSGDKSRVVGYLSAAFV